MDKKLKKQVCKVKSVHLPTDLIALGKSGRTETELKPTNPAQLMKISPLSDRKRELQSLANTIPMKKLKLSSSQLSIPSKIKEHNKGEIWESLAIEVDTKEFIQCLFLNDYVDEDKLEAYVCGILKQLKYQHVKMDPLIYLSLFYLAKTFPECLMTDIMFHAFCSFLKKELNPSFKQKTMVCVPVLAANILFCLYKDEKTWPETFIKMYAEDSLIDRIWVDHEECKLFVDNILTAFNTKQTSKYMFQSENFSSISKVDSSSPVLICSQENNASDCNEDNLNFVISRYINMQDTLESDIVDMIQDNLSRRQSVDNVNRNFLKFLIQACGLPGIRLLAVQKVDAWLQNPKLNRLAHDLLMVICLNCNTHSSVDVEIISYLTKIRLKMKPAINHFLLCLNELLHAHPENIKTLMKIAVYNELSNNKNPNNMVIISALFQSMSEKASSILGIIYMELLCQKDDYTRPLRLLIREIVKVLRYDFPFSVFCLQLLQEPDDCLLQCSENKERLFSTITDIITLCILVSASPSVKETSVMLSRGDVKDIGILHNFQLLIATIQRDAMWWFHTIVMKIYKPSAKEFAHCIHKVLFMEQVEHYYNKDNWPPESERNLLLHLVSEVPVLQDTLLRLMIIGLSKEHPLNAADALELGDQLIKRAASIYMETFPVLEMDKMQLIDIIFNLTSYHHPENIILPSGYTPPKLAITNLYWKAWIMLLIITAHNPSVFGAVAWEGYPTLHLLMEMCITNHFVFPPPSFAAGEKSIELCNKESQLSVVEKEQILQFETYLAAASTKVTITESNSLLLSQLTSMDTGDIARKPPLVIIEQVKLLNTKLKIGTLLCRSRNPDFLLNILQRQGPAQAMPWLADLVESNESAVHLLPIQCLCEFILNDINNLFCGYSEVESTKEFKHVRKRYGQKKQQLVKYIYDFIHSPNTDPQALSEILEYFLQRLSSQQTSARQKAVMSLNHLLYSFKSDIPDTNYEESENFSKLLIQESWIQFIPYIPHFGTVHGSIILALRQACQVENDILLIASYIHFISEYAFNDSLQQLSDLTLDMAQLIVERSTIISFLLPNKLGDRNPNALETLQDLLTLFLRYIEKVREPNAESFSWSECQDQIIVQWSSGETATMHILVVQAIIILLTYGPSKDEIIFKKLLEIWFPSNNEIPTAYLVDTSEETLLFPDWLKLKMIRSAVPVLIKVALKDLDSSQLLLFIQSFGIPIENMSKLLLALDFAVANNPSLINISVMDKTYMTHLVEVQHMRGAIGGIRFVESLNITFSENLIENEVQKSSNGCILLKNEYLNPDVSDSLSLILKQTFSHESSNASYLFDQNFKTVEQKLLKDVNYSFMYSVLNSFVHILKSSDANTFLNGLHSHYLLSTRIFRIMMNVGYNSPSYVRDLLLDLLILLKKYSVNSNSPFSTLIQSFILKIGNLDNNSDKRTSSTSVIKFEKALKCEKIFCLEYLLKELIQSSSSNHSVKNSISYISEIILKSLSPGERNGKHFSTLFFDWIELLDPELINLCPDHKLKLIFSKQMSENFDSSQISNKCYQPYFLSLLTHNCSWNTIRKCIKLILCKFDSCFDAMYVLDFLFACIYIPKLWKGRDKYTSKHSIEEDILLLNDQEVINLIEYVKQEAESNVTEMHRIIENRLPLILKCCIKYNILKTVVEYLFNLFCTKENYSSLYGTILCYLYIKFPCITKLFSNNIGTLLILKQFDENLCHNISSSLDRISHNLFTALSVTESGKECLLRMQDYELACKKLASSHPIFILRQLPMLTNLLHGRVYLEFSIFKEHNHLALYNIILGILELLQPLIFNIQHKNSLQDFFESYFQLFKFHGKWQDPQVVNILERFTSLLNTYLNLSQDNRIQMIQEWYPLLQDLLRHHSDCSSLRMLVQNFSSLQSISQFVENKLHCKNFFPSNSDLFCCSTVSSFTTELNPLFARLRVSNTFEEIKNVLQDLDYISTKKPEVLVNFEEDLKMLISNRNKDVRETAHLLLLHYLQWKPSCTRNCMSSYLECLCSNHFDVVLSALEHITEVAMLGQEHADQLLQKVFDAGLTFHFNVSPYLSDIFTLLNIQTGS